MSNTLLWFSRRSSSAVFAMIWVMIVLGWILDRAGLPVPVRAVGTAISTMILFGYPFLLILGFPAPYSSKTTRRFSILSLSVLGLICIASSIDSLSMNENPITTPWIKFIIGVPIEVLVFAPFFVATHVLGEARRSLGTYKPFDSIGACVSLFFFPFGGVFFLHRSVASAVQSLPISDT
jgi:hypothetical protein